MGEVGEIVKVIEEVEGGIGDEAAETEGMTEEAAKELEAEAAEMKTEVSVLGKAVDYLKALEIPTALRKLVVFVAKNAAVGAIFYGVSLGLSKLAKICSGGPNEKENKQKLAKVKAIKKLITDVNKIATKLQAWLKENQGVHVSVGNSITVPINDLFTKFTDPMAEAFKSVYDVSKTLVKKKADGKTTFNIPTTGQIVQILDKMPIICQNLQGIVDFAKQKEKDFPLLATLTLKKDDVEKLRDDLAAVNQLPY